MDFIETIPYNISEEGAATNNDDLVSKLHFFLTVTSNFNSIKNTTGYIVVERNGFYFHFQSEDYGSESVVSDYVNIWLTTTYDALANSYLDYGLLPDYISCLRCIGAIEQYYFYDNGESFLISTEFEPGFYNSFLFNKLGMVSNITEADIILANYNLKDCKNEITLGDNYESLPNQFSNVGYIYEGILFNIGQPIDNMILKPMNNNTDLSSSKIYLNDKYYLFNTAVVGETSTYLMNGYIPDLFYSYMDGYANAEEFVLSDKTFKAFPNFQKSSPPLNDRKTGQRCFVIRIV